MMFQHMEEDAIISVLPKVTHKRVAMRFILSTLDFMSLLHAPLLPRLGKIAEALCRARDHQSKSHNHKRFPPAHIVSQLSLIHI